MYLIILVVGVALVMGMIMYGIWRKHLLMSLLSLEYMVLGVYLLFNLNYLNYSMVSSMAYLTFTACEGALGLTILITMSRTHGGDYFSSFHMY